MRRNVNNSVETVNAAASAIVSRVEPSSVPVEKKRWGRLYWCFGSQKKNKRINHAEPLQNSSGNNSTSTYLPFIAPPSSPASFLQSVSHTPASGLLSLTPSVFEIGPYAHETQPVTPPVFSAFTTEPSTAPLTPPPESATPSSPEVPFAQLLTSSVSSRIKSGGKYEFQSYQGSPAGANLISPGSVISNSATSSPYPGNCSILDFRIRFESRFGSGSITPAGQGSRLGSGALTPNGAQMVGSGYLTPLECTHISDHHRVSFELTGEDVASKLNRSGFDDGSDEKANQIWGTKNVCESDKTHKVKSFSLGSSKEFKFDSTKQELMEKYQSPGHGWSFFPLLRSGLS